MRKSVLKEKRMAGPQRSVCEFPEHGQDGPFQKELKAAGIVSCQGIMNEVADYKIVLRTWLECRPIHFNTGWL